MRTGNRQEMLLLLMAALAAVFAIGFFAGRQSVPYEVSAQTGRMAQSSSDAAQAAQAASNGQGDEAAAQEDAGYPIDLNCATLEELMTLPRIGQTLAQRILDYRAQYGRFSAPEQLMDVEGIGEATFAGLKELVCVEGSK